MKSTGFLATVIGLITVADAHMEVTYPPPFRSKYNSFTTDIDYDMTNPLSGSGSNFPCKGYHNLWDTAQGRSVATWTAGQTYNFTLAGSATHNGGSCQVSLSYDRGKTFRVIQSYIGNCPLVNSWKFTLPNDTPSGDVLWSWSWFNQIGNREMYNNCARITIKARSLKEREIDEQEAAAKRSPSDPFSSRPTWFVANVGNGCSTVEGKDVQFPKPGPDVAYASTKGTTAPVGSCGSSKRALPLRV